ncbi:helix-turn-helix domain-containing protein [Heyndrickxia sp. FSL W8-0496]|uniref:helix-turn-helix domain-containing protein n=1 Tax=Heyndrickxia sp. FSL W8-0496 TaxID=2954702 RepID=UPI0030F559FA
MSTLGERLKKARERKGLSQTEVYRRTNINNKTLSRYEKGGSEPDSETLKILANIYDVSADYLLGISTNESPIEKDNASTTPLDKIWLRADTSGLSKDEQDILKEDLADYFEFRKSQLLKDKHK